MHAFALVLEPCSNKAQAGDARPKLRLQAVCSCGAAFAQSLDYSTFWRR